MSGKEDRRKMLRKDLGAFCDLGWPNPSNSLSPAWWQLFTHFRDELCDLCVSSVFPSSLPLSSLESEVSLYQSQQALSEGQLWGKSGLAEWLVGGRVFLDVGHLMQCP